jgi:hypothetical protein
MRFLHHSNIRELTAADFGRSHIGSSFTDFLKEDGPYENVTAHATKRVLAWQIEQAMHAQGPTNAEMAKA